MFNAEIIADSKNLAGDRITTFVVTFPRIILSEFNTHRVLSKNSASSRAIPYKKMLMSVLENPFIPIAWMKDHSGMQGQEFYSKDERFSVEQALPIISEKLQTIFEDDKFTTQLLYTRILEDFRGTGNLTLDEFWLKVRDKVVTCSLLLNSLGVSKQICNRLLEPFMWHRVIVTGTEWENFFALRAHGASEMHMQKLAELMLDSYNSSEPKILQDGDWHIPFGDNINLTAFLKKHGYSGVDVIAYDLLRVKVATARCARISYTVIGSDFKDNSEADIDLHDKFLDSRPLHASPFEHCAQASSKYEGPLSGNFVRGFIQYRKMLQGERASDPRVLKK